MNIPTPDLLHYDKEGKFLYRITPFGAKKISEYDTETLFLNYLLNKNYNDEDISLLCKFKFIEPNFFLKNLQMNNPNALQFSTKFNFTTQDLEALTNAIKYKQEEINNRIISENKIKMNEYLEKLNKTSKPTLESDTSIFTPASDTVEQYMYPEYSDQLAINANRHGYGNLLPTFAGGSKTKKNKNKK